MKRIIPVLFIAALLMNFPVSAKIEDIKEVKGGRDRQAEPADFSGEWDWLDSKEGASFYLRLEQDGTKIFGSYCATAFFGRRIDCGFEQAKCKISGTVSGNTASIEFTSCYSGKKGKAKIIKDEDKIIWIIRRIYLGRWYFCPRKAVLEKSIKIW